MPGIVHASWRPDAIGARAIGGISAGNQGPERVWVNGSGGFGKGMAGQFYPSFGGSSGITLASHVCAVTRTFSGLLKAIRWCRTS